MLGIKKKQEIREDIQDNVNKEKIEQLEAKEVEIEEEIEEIKEEVKEVPKEESKEADLDDDFDDEYDDEEDVPLEYSRKDGKEELAEEKEGEVGGEEKQNQLNGFLIELDARVGKIESILFRLTQNGKQ